MPTGGSPALGVLSGQCMELSQQWGRLESSGMSPLPTPETPTNGFQLLVVGTQKSCHPQGSWQKAAKREPRGLRENQETSGRVEASESEDVGDIVTGFRK